MVAIFIEPEDMKVYSELNDVKKTLKFTSAPINEDIQKYNVYLKSLPEKQMVAELNGKIQMAFAKAKGYSVLLMDGELDTPAISMLEQKFEKSRFTRVDADIADRLITKDDEKKNELGEDESAKLSEVFKTQMPKIDKAESPCG